MLFAGLSERQLRQAAADLDRVLWAVGVSERRSIKPLATSFARLLAGAFKGREGEAVAAAVGSLGGRGRLTQADLDRALTAASRAVGKAWTPRIERSVRASLVLAYTMGRKEVLKPIRLQATLTQVDRQAQDWLRRDTLFWVRESWDRVLGRRIADKVREEMLETGIGRVEAAERLRDLMGSTFRESDAYWRVVASAASVRARAFGCVESFVQAEAKTYQWLALDDDRSCAGCMNLDGMTWQVASAVALRDRVMAAKSPDEVREAHPWKSVGELSKLTAKQAEAGGMIAPPVHGNCRCTLVVKDFAGISTPSPTTTPAPKPSGPPTPGEPDLGPVTVTPGKPKPGGPKIPEPPADVDLTPRPPRPTPPPRPPRRPSKPAPNPAYEPQAIDPELITVIPKKPRPEGFKVPLPSADTEAKPPKRPRPAKSVINDVVTVLKPNRKPGFKLPKRWWW